MSKPHSFLPPGQGPKFDWEDEHTFVKVGASASNGTFTLMEENVTKGFRLGLHVHKAHSQTFYIDSGTVDFYVNGEWMTAEAGACLHVPAGVPHACELHKDSAEARMLMIFQPSGFDQYVEEMSRLTAGELADQQKITALKEKHDIFDLGDVPAR